MPYLKKQAPCPEPIDCRILTAALELFVEKGYYNVSIHEIQKQADVSIGSIYRHFKGKEGVANALYLHLLNEIDELIDVVMQEKAKPIEQLEEIIKQLFEHTETHPQIISFIFHTKHTDFLPNETSMLDSEPFKRIRDIIINVVGANDDKNKYVATSLIMGGMTRMIQLRLDNISSDPLVDSLDVFMNNLWMGIKLG